MKRDEYDNGEVLVVEDTPGSLKLLTDLLKGAGYTVRQAPDGELALWSAQSRPPELILLDIRMPGIDGFEVCRRLKAHPQLAAIPVIFLSAQHDPEDKVRGFEAGAVDFIGKPYQAEEVLARAHVHISLARTQKALSRTNADLSRTLEQLRNARDDVLRSESLAALGSLVTGIAQELNTPIGNSVLTASTLADSAGDFEHKLASGVRKSELERFVADIRQASGLLLRNLEKSADLVTSFKQVAIDQTRIERRRFDLARLLHDMRIMLGPALRDTKVECEICVADGIWLDTYPGALCQVIGHLVQNALRHAFAPGQAGTIRVSASLEGEQVRLRFIDDGCGIPAEHVDRIFERGFSTTPEACQAGLGLYVARKLVDELMGGHICVMSAPGATCFEIWLPLTLPAA